MLDVDGARQNPCDRFSGYELRHFSSFAAYSQHPPQHAGWFNTTNGLLLLTPSRPKRPIQPIHSDVFLTTGELHGGPPPPTPLRRRRLPLSSTSSSLSVCVCEEPVVGGPTTHSAFGDSLGCCIPTVREGSTARFGRCYSNRPWTHLP